MKKKAKKLFRTATQFVKRKKNQAIKLFRAVRRFTKKKLNRNKVLRFITNTMFVTLFVGMTGVDADAKKAIILMLVSLAWLVPFFIANGWTYSNKKSTQHRARKLSA